MILCHKPRPIYDVDLLGAVGVALLAAAGWLFVAVPWERTWRDYHALSTRYAARERARQRDVAELEDFQRKLTQLSRTVAEQVNDIPGVDAMPRLLREMTDLAKQAQVDLLSVAPQAATPDGAYLVSDIQVAGRGRSLDFVRFVDALAQQNPYYTLRAFSIGRAAAGPQPTCELAWTIRLYLWPAAGKPESGGRS